MIELTHAQIAEYFRRSYTAIDGLWFMKAEERFGFDQALGIDTEVWKIMPKIQARALRALTGLGDGIDALFECFGAKLSIEGFTYTAERRPDHIEFRITRCPWHDLREKSGRADISGRVGDTICLVENSVWAEEFHDDIAFEQGMQLCKGAHACVLKFAKRG
jgi:hypothetical protein